MSERDTFFVENDIVNASIVSSEKGTELKDKRIWNCCIGEFVGVVYYLLLKITLYRVESCVLCCWIEGKYQCEMPAVK